MSAMELSTLESQTISSSKSDGIPLSMLCNGTTLSGNFEFLTLRYLHNSTRDNLEIWDVIRAKYYARWLLLRMIAVG